LSSNDEGERSGIDHTLVANPILVPDDITNESPTTTPNIPVEEELDSSRLALIGSRRTIDGVNQSTQVSQSEVSNVQEREEGLFLLVIHRF
jgi:hypothetical protein